MNLTNLDKVIFALKITIFGCILFNLNSYSIAQIGTPVAPMPSPTFPTSSDSNVSTYCAKTYKAYLSMDPNDLYGGTYTDSNYGGAPPTAYYLTPMPAAGAIVPPSGLPLCAGTYSVTVYLGWYNGGCGGGRCNNNIRLYANNEPSFSGSVILIGDAGLGKDLPPNKYYTTSLGSVTWKTSWGALYPPLFRAVGGDPFYLVPGKDSYINLQWTGP